MGNQESVINDKYELKKKINSNDDYNKTLKTNNNKNNVENSIDKSNTMNSINKTKNKSTLNNNNNMNNNRINKNNSYTNNSTNNHNYRNNGINNGINKNNIDYNINTNSSNNINEYNTKKLNKDQNNSALISRNILTDVYQSKSKNNFIFDYPSNSNNELDIPKKNIENLKFTPYNFNDEVSTFNKQLDDERIEFEKKEKDRRLQFEKNEKYKKEYLNSQIKNFEKEYNPWDILGLEYNNLNPIDIKKAYKKSALKYHPDKAGKKYEDLFQLITQSYIYLLNKSEESNFIENKINKKVENIDYEDNVNEKTENIYINKDKFDLNQFNQIFDKYKIPTKFDKGYTDLMKEDIKINNDEIFGSNFNKDIFNAHFDNIKKKKKNNLDIIEYNEPMALETSFGNFNQSPLGIDDIDDFGAVNNSSGLSYTDYKKAHVDETTFIDTTKVQYKSYKSVEQLENDRSKVSYEMSPEDKRRYEYMERKKQEDDQRRIQIQRDYDNMMESQYNKLNRKLIIHK
jgi:curved DNA-binding protein CbpA